jgi:GNAT superfamily N-acetyltransferase
MKTMLRELRPTDLPDLVGLSTHAGWNQTRADWEMLLALSPDGCFGIEVDSRIIATTTLLCFDQTMAWVGMVLTHPSHRRQGFARRLVEHALQQARQREIATLKLDATEEGRPVYEAFGFRSERTIERRLLTNHQAPAPSESRSGLATTIFTLDQVAYSYDRAPILGALAQRSQIFQEPDGYLLFRPGRVASYIGPFGATTPSTAGRLLAIALQNSQDTRCYWDIFPENTAAVALAEAHGFVPKRTLTRMSLGRENIESTKYIYGIAGFEIG